MTTVHIVNHTHWDREWFATSVYTSRWIPRLIDKLASLAAENLEFRFLFDGQTLVIEDLLAIAPSCEEKVRGLVSSGRLQIGPYYCQPDWQLTGGELLIRNLTYGQQDVARFGGTADTGWLVDTFGHISQSPQIHHIFGIDAVFVWRGVPQLEPYFNWQGADGCQILTINLFGGYRNLYGVTHVPEVAGQRLEAEVDKLRPFYPTPDLPLFDGYDLEDDPEDPLSFYAQQGELRADLQLLEATPSRFAKTIHAKKLPLPAIGGELNSGKYGATFPGTFSTRAYLKVMARDCQHLLFQVCEPLATMAWLSGRDYDVGQFETWGRMLLQNAVHDCICGVSIDQVHEKMAYTYRQVYDGAQETLQEALAAVLAGFAPGDYAVSTVPFALETGLAASGDWVYLKIEGAGVWPVTDRLPIEAMKEPVETFTWRNNYYEAKLDGDGVLRLDSGSFGRLVVSAEHGDTYSDSLGDQLGVIRPSSTLTVVERSEHHCVVAFDGQWQDEQRWASASVRLQFDHSPLLRWQIDLDSRGSDFRVEMVFDTGQPGRIYAGMPFDVVERQPFDDDLLPRQLPSELASVLLGQRELGQVAMFPFHDFVAIEHGGGTTAVLAKGIHAYHAGDGRTISLTLRRAVEWLTKADLKDRVGDAGPFFYVPDARCERRVRHEVAITAGNFAADSMALQRINAAYQNPPLVVRKSGTGQQSEWQLLRENVPLSSLQVCDGAPSARFYNPTSGALAFAEPREAVDPHGRVTGRLPAVQPKDIVTVLVDHPARERAGAPADVTLLTPLQWRVGTNMGRPDPAVLAQLEQKVADLEAEIVRLEAEIARNQGKTRLRHQHRSYVLQRERLEYRLSIILAERKSALVGEPDYDYLFEPDEEIAAVSTDLNRLRIKRRIYDYVIESLD